MTPPWPVRENGDMERVCLAADWLAWPAPFRRLADRRVARRQLRWDAAADVVQQELGAVIGAAVRNGRRPQPDATALDAAQRVMDRVATERPARPTWSGDRIHAVAVRLDRDHHLGLATVWPHLWLTLPSSPAASGSTSPQRSPKPSATPSPVCSRPRR
ncbi:hypothetical protein ACFXA3_03720 [Streptomyces sp. NPDC059456]|uniref:hypothetical protein n=1 Tax=Streptomyces sp. NPDC059456 TaxID=3346838 RepID=UPI0036C56097